MTDHIDREALKPLLDFIGQETDPALRLAALDAASRFPLDEGCWFELAVIARDLIHELPPGSADRREALRVAAAIPLLSVRRQLRDMADDVDEPDADVIASVLSTMGDPSQVRRLAAAVRGGDLHRLPELAAMPLEDADLRPDDIPMPDEDDDPSLLLWRALVLARLGAHEAIEGYLTGQVEPPPMFWGNPWRAYDELATIRPLPPALDAVLHEALPGIERVADSERRRMAELIVWACTGIADAEGTLLDEAGRQERSVEVAPSPGGAAVSPEEAALAAQRIVERVSDPEALEADPTPEELDKLTGLSPETVNRLVVELIARANRRMETSTSPEWLQVPLGNTIINIVNRVPINPAWPIKEIAGYFLSPGPKALDLGQFAWILARPAARAITSALAPALSSLGSASEEHRLLELIGQVGQTQAGRAGSPWRGAGPGGAGAPRAPLIDDEPEVAMRGGIELPAPEAAGSTPEETASVAAKSEQSESASAESGWEESENEEVEPEEAVTVAPDRRRVNAQIWAHEVKRDTFLAGVENTIRCWIGLPAADVAAVSDADIQQVDDIPEEGLELVVQLGWEGQTDTTRTRLPPGRTARTGDCDLRIDVPESERYIKADVAFRYRGRVFEHVRMEAAVLGAGDDAQPRDRLQVRVQTQLRQVIELEDRSEIAATFIYSAESTADGAAPTVPTLLEFGSQGVARYSLDSASTAVAWLNKELFIADKNLVRSKANAASTDDAEPLLAADDEDVLSILRQLAQHGAGFYNQLVGQHFTDPGRRLQLLNRTPREYVPLEFVYDRGYPSNDATLCDGWRDALAGDADECPCCGPPPPPHDDARDNAPRICPMGFWSLKKIIERLDPLDGTPAGAGPSVPRNGRRELAPIDRVLFGASHRVKQLDRDATLARLRQIVPQVDLAEDWPAWKTAIRRANVPLLLALPHHGTKNNQDFLEIGGEPMPEADRELQSGRLTNGYVNPNNVDPGPIVLLIGCETGAGTSTGYPTLARTFQQLHTSIVVGTLAKVLGRHAAPVAQELVTQLVSVDDPDVDFGTIMRRVRRRMLLKGYLMALCIVALGDADWHLASGRPRTSPGVGADEV